MNAASPLPTVKPEPLPKFDRDGVPWSEYVRCVEFIDRNPQAADEAPIHVLGYVEFDGVATTARVAKTGVTVDLGDGGTVVTMQVWHEDVQIGEHGEEGFTPWLIGGRRVATPVGEGWDWVPVDDDTPEWIVCAFYVAEVHVR